MWNPKFNPNLVRVDQDLIHKIIHLKNPELAVNLIKHFQDYKMFVIRDNFIEQ